KRQILQPEHLEELRKSLEQLPDKPTAEDTKQLRDELQDELRFHQLLGAFVSDAPLSLDHRHDRIILSAGYGDGRPIVLPGPKEEEVDKKGAQDAAIIAFAKTLKTPLKEGRTADTVIADFLKK